MRASAALRITCGALLTLLAHHFVLAQSSAQNPAQQRNTRQWYEAYDEGLNHIQGRRWQQAIDSLLAAKAARGQQARRVAFYGDRIDAYIPDYYLGVAYTELGRFAEAEAAFQRVTDQKLVVQGDRTFQNLQAQSARARTGAAALARGTGAQGPQQTAANTPAPAGGAANPAQTPVQSPAQLPVPGPAQTAANATPESTVAAGPDTTVQTAPAGPIGRGQQNAAAPAAAANRPPAVAPRNVPRTPATARLTETDGVAAFFSGDYNTAGRILETVVTANSKAAPPPSPRAWLFLASTITAQVLTGDRQRSELTAARQLLSRAGSLEQFAADRRLISPRIWAALGVQQ